MNSPIPSKIRKSFSSSPRCPTIRYKLLTASPGISIPNGRWNARDLSCRTWFEPSAKRLAFCKPGGRRKTRQPLDTYAARIFLKDGKELQGLYVTIRQSKEQEMYTIDVSESFASKDDIARVEFRRQRFRRAVVKDVPLRLDLQPEDKD